MNDNDEELEKVKAYLGVGEETHQLIREKIKEVLRLIDKGDPRNFDLDNIAPHHLTKDLEEYVYRICSGILMEDYYMGYYKLEK